MLTEPFGPLWKDRDAEKRIERRLDHQYNSFQDTVRDMLAIMEKLKSGLGVNPEGKSEWGSGGAIKRNLKRASLVIKSPSYNEALQGLFSKNQTLETIVMGSLRLEPSRGKRSRIKYLELLRRVVNSVYKALRLGLCETCPLSHRICLQLLAPELSLRGDEGKFVEELDFRVTLSHHDAPWPRDPNSGTWNWREVKLQADLPPRGIKAGGAGEGKVRKRVVFIGEVPLQMNNIQLTTLRPAAARASNLPMPPQLMTGRLCQSLGIDSLRSKTCGYVIDPSVPNYGRFSVIHLDEIHDSCSLTFISIQDVMKTWRQRSVPSLPQKLALAFTIASGIIQMHQTPWISMTITSQTLYLRSFDDVISFDQAYVSKTAPTEECCHRPKCLGPCEGNTAGVIPTMNMANELMWALFVLLIEVILWRSIDEVLTEKLGTVLPELYPKQVFDYTTERGFEIVRSLLTRVAMAGSQEYSKALECCLKLASGYPNLDLSQEELRHQIYGGIIMPIEDSWENSKNLTITKGGVSLTY
ncbi:hypothetical protein F5Y08DRAFT_291272 [Xylaria arbuscula]|nr:hypothetical protein F5Y08DRAFT_291272 [Xylaria arbuscula]